MAVLIQGDTLAVIDHTEDSLLRSELCHDHNTDVRLFLRLYNDTPGQPLQRQVPR